ncbi:MAG: hypothetical protein QXE87_05195 [Candidatus Methanomethylicaceae archaeon]
MKKIFSIILIPLIIISIIPVYSLPFNQLQQQEQINARNMLTIANMARERVELMLRNIMTNTTLMNLNKTVIDNCNITLEQAKKLIEEANIVLNNGNYNETMNKLIEAMKLLRNCFIKLCELSYEETPKALGLIEAINNTAIRIEKLNETLQTLSEKIINVSNLIEKAKSILNEAMLLYSQGNVSAAANKLGEVNSIMAQINVMLKNKAQERLMIRLNEFAKKITPPINNTKEFQNMMRNIEEKNIRDAINALKSLNISQQLPIINKYLELYINASRNSLEITISNIGNSTLQFPNSAYGITIERKVGNLWMLYYSPISAQVITSLEPGKSVNLKISLHLVPGTYRVVTKAWTEGMKEQLFTYKEFTIK